MKTKIREVLFFDAVVLSIFLCFLSPQAAQAQRNTNTITDSFMPGDELVEAIRFGFSRAGLASPFTSFPVGIRQCESAVEELRMNPSADPDVLSRLDELLVSYMIGAVEAGADLAYQMYLRTSDELIETASVTNGIDLYRLYLNQPAPVRADVAYSGRAGFSLRAESTLRRENDSKRFHLDNFWQMGGAGNPVGIENHDFTRGYVAYSNGTFRVLFGRDKIHLGPETFSSILPSNRLPYWDSLRATVPMGPVRMDWYLSTIPSYKLDDDAPLDAPTNPFGYYGESDQNIILNALHRFEWRSQSFRVALTGNVIYVRPNNYFELSDLFPALSWHANDVEPNNLCLVLDFSWAFLPGWTLSGQAGYDDISATIVGVGDNKVPTIDAYVLGLRWDGGTIQRRQNALLEFGFTHYLWGSYDEVATGHDFATGSSSGTLARAIYRFRLDWGAAALPLTSPYGPGALWLRGGYSFKNLIPGMDLHAEGLVLSKNTLANLITTDYTADSTVENGARNLYTEISLGLSYEFAGIQFLLQPLFAVRDDKAWAELSLGVSYGFHMKKQVENAR